MAERVHPVCIHCGHLRATHSGLDASGRGGKCNNLRTRERGVIGGRLRFGVSLCDCPGFDTAALTYRAMEVEVTIDGPGY